MADRVCGMSEGGIVEAGPTAQVFTAPRHAYTRRLRDAEPRGRKAPAVAGAPIVMQGEAVKVWFPIKAGVFRRTVAQIRAVDRISLTVREGQTVGVGGESGPGKTALGMGLLRPERRSRHVSAGARRVGKEGGRAWNN